jgi:hypothetical protein
MATLAVPLVWLKSRDNFVGHIGDKLCAKVNFWKFASTGEG